MQFLKPKKKSSIISSQKLFFYLNSFKIINEGRYTTTSTFSTTFSIFQPWFLALNMTLRKSFTTLSLTYTCYKKLVFFFFLNVNDIQFFDHSEYSKEHDTLANERSFAAFKSESCSLRFRLFFAVEGWSQIPGHTWSREIRNIQQRAAARVNKRLWSRFHLTCPTQAWLGYWKQDSISVRLFAIDGWPSREAENRLNPWRQEVHLPPRRKGELDDAGASEL